MRKFLIAAALMAVAAVGLAVPAQATQNPSVSFAYPANCKDAANNSSGGIKVTLNNTLSTEAVTFHVSHAWSGFSSGGDYEVAAGQSQTINGWGGHATNWALPSKTAAAYSPHADYHVNVTAPGMSAADSNNYNYAKCSKVWDLFEDGTDDASLDLRTVAFGGTWQEDNHDWTQQDFGSEVYGTTAAVGSGGAKVGYATLDSNMSNNYTTYSLVTMSPTNNRAAPGVTVNFLSKTNNVFFKLELTPLHQNGNLLGGVNINGTITSGPTICDSGALGIGTGEGSQYIIEVTRTGDGSHIIAKVYSASALMYSGIPTPLNSATALGTCDFNWGAFTGGTSTQRANISAADRVGFRVKILDDGTNDSEDNGQSRFNSIQAIDLT